MDEANGKRELVVIGASAGGVEALQELVSKLPRSCAAAFLVVLHIGTRRSGLPQALERAGPLPAVWAVHGQEIRPNRIYIAPPDHHLLIASDCHHLLLSRGPKENHSRPAVDTLFRSAAHACGARTVGVVLSGMLADGTAGLAELAAHGAITAVQDPREARHPGMPQNALRYASPDYCLPMTGIADRLVNLCCHNAGPAKGRMPKIVTENVEMQGRELKQPVALTCPMCGGSVAQSKVDGLPYFACHTGHRFAAQNFEDAQYQQMEQAMEVALRVLNERAELARKLGEAARNRGQRHAAAHWDKAVQEATDRAEVLIGFIQLGWERPFDDEDDDGHPNPPSEKPPSSSVQNC